MYINFDKLKIFINNRLLVPRPSEPTSLGNRVGFALTCSPLPFGCLSWNNLRTAK